MKPVMISLMYLTFGGDIKMESFEVVSGQSCESWYAHNVRVEERKQRKVFSNHYYHKYQDKDVIGYICGGEEPQ